jgi:hypothetical protein
MPNIRPVPPESVWTRMTTGEISVSNTSWQGQRKSPLEENPPPAGSGDTFIVTDDPDGWWYLAAFADTPMQ